MSGALDTLEATGAGLAEATPAPTAVAAPAPAAAAEPAPAADTTPTAAAEPGPATEAAPSADAPAPDPAEPKVEGAAEAAAAAEPEPAAATPPTYEAWTLPEGLTLADEQTGAMNNIFGKYGLTQEAGQELVNFASGILRTRQEEMLQNQQDVFLETRAKWAKEAEKTFGNQYKTITSDARAAMEAAVPVKERQAFSDMLRVTGAGDHPLFIKAWGALGKKLREPRSPGPTTPSPPQERREDRRYRPRPQ